MTGPRISDVLVIGGGVIGLSSALALAERGLSVRLVSKARRGEASPAAGGLLSPSIDPFTGAAHDFAVRSRDRYPEFVAALAHRTGVAVPLSRDGVLQIALDERAERGLAR